MAHYKNGFISKKPGKASVFGIVLICGFLFTSQGILSPGGAGAPDGSSGANYITTIAGKNWKLSELRFSGRTVILNRNELSADMTDIFTLTVDNERISGKGAPNRYFTSYQAGTTNTLTIFPIASTLMASLLFDPQRIREEDYFQYLGKVTSWKLNQNKLELYSADPSGKELVMVYVD